MLRSRSLLSGAAGGDSWSLPVLWPAALHMCLQVHGAAETAWSAAAATTRAESAAGCPEPDELKRKLPSVQLLPQILELGRCLRAAARLSIARSLAYGPEAALFEV